MGGTLKVLCQKQLQNGNMEPAIFTCVLFLALNTRCTHIDDHLQSGSLWQAAATIFKTRSRQGSTTPISPHVDSVHFLDTEILYICADADYH